MYSQGKKFKTSFLPPSITFSYIASEYVLSNDHKEQLDESWLSPTLLVENDM